MFQLRQLNDLTLHGFLEIVIKCFKSLVASDDVSVLVDQEISLFKKQAFTDLPERICIGFPSFTKRSFSILKLLSLWALHFRAATSNIKANGSRTFP